MVLWSLIVVVFVWFEVCQFKSVQHSTAFEYSNSMHTATEQDRLNMIVTLLIMVVYYAIYLVSLSANLEELWKKSLANKLVFVYQ